MIHSCRIALALVLSGILFGAIAEAPGRAADPKKAKKAPPKPPPVDKKTPPVDKKPPSPLEEKPLGEWTKQLAAPEASARLKAVQALGTIGPDAAPALPEMRRLLRDDETEVREAVLKAMAQLGPASAEAALDLLPFLSDVDPEFRLLAVRAVGASQTSEPRLVLALAKLHLDAVKDKAPRVSRLNETFTIAETLRRMGKNARAALPLYREAMKGADPAQRRSLVGVAGRLGPESLPLLIDALADPDREVARLAVGLMALHREEAKEVTPQLTEALKRFNEPRLIVDIFKNMGDDGVPYLKVCLKHPDPEVNRVAAEMLAEMKEKALPALDDLAALLSDKIAHLAAAKALSAIGPDAMPAVIAALKNDDTRLGAFSALARIGPSAKEAVPSLVQILKEHDGPEDPTKNPNPERQWRNNTVSALKEIGEPAVPGLLEGLSTSESTGIPNVLVQIGQKKPAAAKAMVGPLVKLLDSEDAKARSRALDVLGKVGAVDKESLHEAFAAAERALQDPDVQVKQFAVTAMNQLKDHAKKKGLPLP